MTQDAGALLPCPFCGSSAMTSGDARERISAYLLARDEEGSSRPLPPYLIEWGMRNVLAGKDAAHAGDCTNEPYSCLRCISDAVLFDADAIPALGAAQASRHTGTYLGYRNDAGEEMHCANAFCPHQDKCIKGCISRKAVALPSASRGTEA